MKTNIFKKILLISFLVIVFTFCYLIMFHQMVFAASTMPADGSANMKIVDISEFNDSVTNNSDNIDFSLLKTQVNAIYIRSFGHTNATLSIDKQAVNYVQSAQNVKLDFGFYYFYIPTADLQDAKSQAQIFYNFIKNYDYECVPALDVENNDNNLTKAQLASAVKTFADEFKSLSGHDLMIYTYPYFMKNNFDTSFSWSSYKLWIANYGVSAPMEGISSTWMPQEYWCWSEWDMWQYTSTGTLSSIPNSSYGHLDMSYATDNILLSAISYQSHVQNIGWQDWVSNGDVSGTSGQSLRMEAVNIKLQNIDGGVEYRTHVQDIGWMGWVSDGALSGTRGQSKRLEAIEIQLTGAAAQQYDIYYRVHAQDIGWMDWAKNGEPSGTAGYSYRLEAIQIILVLKGSAAPGATMRPFAEYIAPPTVSYQSHVQNMGWQGYVNNGGISGTSGQSLRLEAICMKLDNINAGIEYRTHVQDIGWMDWVSNNAESGTSGQSRRLEAIEIRLTGAAAEQYDVYYRVHAQNIGWMDWAKNGESSGTAGLSYRLEAIQVLLVSKGSSAPGATASPFIQG